MVATAANTLSPQKLKEINMPHFYSYDGTWRTAEPSWRLMLLEHENIRGCTSYANTLNDPALMNSLQRGRRALPAKAAPPPPSVDPAAKAAAHAFMRLNFKDQKLSGFANETMCHTGGPDEPERWGRLGIMTRERLTSADRFGDIATPVSRPVTAPVGVKPATYPKFGPMGGDDIPPMVSAPESSGFTRRPLLHSAKMLTGGFVYHEPAAKPEPATGDVKVVGNKLPTGYTIGNHDVAAEDATGAGDTMRPSMPETHWARTSIGTTGTYQNWYDGANARLTAYGEMHRRKLAPHETGGDVKTLRVETSGFTRNKLHQMDHIRLDYVPAGVKVVEPERKLQGVQIALRKMANPIEYTAPHAHKERKPK